MSPLNHKIGIALLCAWAFAAAAANAGTAADDSVPTEQVKYRESELAQPGGAARLYRRIEKAAQHVCREPDNREIRSYAEYLSCYHSALDRAVATVNVTELTAYHHSRTQRSAAG